MSFALSVFFFFFKQKTAYEMRISDWSSDVCSSDLTGHGGGPDGTCWLNTAGSNHSDPGFRASRYYPDIPLGLCLKNGNVRACFAGLPAPVAARPDLRLPAPARAWRSAEHTSELQSIMRTSYAVFCLKKKKQALKHSKNKNITT